MVLVGGLALGARGSHEAAAAPATDLARMRAIYPDLQAASPAVVRQQADALCEMIRGVGGYPAFVRLARTNAAKQSGTFPGSKSLDRALRVAMHWRCPELRGHLGS